eukprot:6098007-Pyramimonas_sp.AAC.1
MFCVAATQREHLGALRVALSSLGVAAHLPTVELVRALRHHDLPVVQLRAHPTPAEALRRDP